jgi:hypothetical protein
MAIVGNFISFLSFHYYRITLFIYLNTILLFVSFNKVNYMHFLIVNFVIIPDFVFDRNLTLVPFHNLNNHFRFMGVWVTQ